MALGLYKPGQGYWVRVMTACLVGLITVATAAWLWQQGEIIADRLPKSVWTLGLRAVAGEVAAGQKIDLIGAADRASSQPVIGSAVVQSYKPDEQAVRIHQITLLAERDVGEAVAISGPAAVGATVVSRNAVPAVEPLYIKGGLAATVIIIGAIMAYWLAGMRVRTVEFLIATDFEMKKVNWSTFREIRGSTLVVIGACVLISTALFAFDFLFKTVFQTIGVLAK
ncbi:MAG: preprotein translocase subunit SecE [Phycisphaerales bacterium]